MENRIKECQLDLYADRTSAATMRANQLRLWFYSMAYVLLCALRRIGLHDSDLAQATCGAIRLKLLKIGSLVRISARSPRVVSFWQNEAKNISKFRARDLETEQLTNVRATDIAENEVLSILEPHEDAEEGRGRAFSALPPR